MWPHRRRTRPWQLRLARHAGALSKFERGQSLVELALALPVLLVLLLGLADAGRLLFYSIAISNAAREAAVFAARNPRALPSAITERACRELALTPSQCNPSVLLVDAKRDAARDNAQVTVTYRIDLATASLAQLIATNPVRIQATAAVVGLSE